MSNTLTDFITQDLRECLRASRALPAPLSLPGLAAHYRVSLTPVRRAMQTLLAEGLLERTANGRLEIAAQGMPALRQEETERRGFAGSEADAPPCLPSEASLFRADSAPDWEARLVQDIVIRSLRGEVAYLREEAASWHYGVGRTALRAAFGRLVGKGLLVHVRRCGWRVRAFDADDLRAYLVMREALEVTALELALPYLDPQKLQAMRDGNAISAGNAPARLNNELHLYLIEMSGNAYIQDFFDRHGLYYAALFDFAAPEAHVVDEMALQHRSILDALIRQEKTAAREALTLHIRAQYPIVQQLLATLNAAPPPHDGSTRSQPSNSKEKAS